MGRPVLLTLRVVAVGVHGITRIHGGQKQKDIKSDPQSEITPFFGRSGCISSLRVPSIFGLDRRIQLQILFRTTLCILTEYLYVQYIISLKLF